MRKVMMVLVAVAMFMGMVGCAANSVWCNFGVCTNDENNPYSAAYKKPVEPGERYKQICDSWMGQDVNNLIREWGAPTKTFNMPNGNTMYEWSRHSTETTPAMTLPSTTTYNTYGNTTYQNNPMAVTVGGNTITYYCTTGFEVNPQGIIIFYRYQGNSCLAN